LGTHSQKFGNAPRDGRLPAGSPGVSSWHSRASIRGHRSAYGYGVAEGTLIGEYLVHFEDDRVETIPIVVGQDVRDWWDRDNSKEVTRGKVAWTGVNEASLKQNKNLRLYLTTWENPKPDKKVVSIDYVSKKTNAGPSALR
jgi:hypothetical protein